MVHDNVKDPPDRQQLSPGGGGAQYTYGQQFAPTDQEQHHQQLQLGSSADGRSIAQAQGGASVGSAWMGRTDRGIAFPPGDRERGSLISPPNIPRDSGDDGGAFSAPAPLHIGGPYQGPGRSQAAVGGGSPHQPMQAISKHRTSRQRAASQELYGMQTFRPVLPPQDASFYGSQQQQLTQAPTQTQQPMGAISSYEPSHPPGRSLPSYSPAQYSPSRYRPASVASNVSVESQDSGGSGQQQKGGFKKGAAAKKRTRKTPSPQVSSGGDDDDGSTTPLPQNLRGDPFRSAKVKTELCRNFMSGKGCPFGDKCNYAHGEHELKYTKLLHLENAGLVDVEIFRTRPCITWMATGACPFDQRCIGLHDPRVAGSHPSWLPHAETLLNGILSTKNVDKTYHQQLTSVYSCSPLYGYIPDRKWKSDEAMTFAAWKHFYAYICNVTGQPCLLPPPEICRVAIALKMRENKIAQCYAYRPTHVLQGELCMVLQKRIFVIPAGVAISSEDMLEVTGDTTYTTDPTKTLGKELITGHEIAFGPVGDPSVRPVTVWFNIPKGDLVECTQQQAKRHKRSRHRIKKAEERGKAKTIVSAETSRKERATTALLHCPSDDLDGSRARPFYNYQPIDMATFDLVTDILKHRLHFLDSVAMTPQDPSSNSRAHEKLQEEEKGLAARFESQHRHWMTWSWPVHSGVDQITEATDVPPVGGTYVFDIDEPDNFQVEAFFGFNDAKSKDVISRRETKMVIGYLWESFLINTQLVAGKMPTILSDGSLATIDEAYRKLRRLPIFRMLSMGTTIFPNRKLPIFSSLSPPRRSPSPRTSPSRPSVMDGFFKEWEELVEYYDKTQSSPLRSSQEAEGGNKGSKSSQDAAKKVDKLLNSAAMSEMRIRI